MKKVNLRFSILAIILSFSFLSLNPISAGANTLVSTSPISGSTVSVSPTNVTITGQLPLLADAVDANVITVKDPNGDRVDDGTISISDLSATVGLKPLIVTGMYRVSYSLLSEADEPLVGEFSFKYLAPSNIAPVEPNPEPTQSQSPASSSWATNVFVILLLIGAIIVTIGLSLYARKIYSER
jgi:methionine-rich copper-binding protein CopC